MKRKIIIALAAAVILIVGFVIYQLQSTPEEQEEETAAIQDTTQSPSAETNSPDTSPSEAVEEVSETSDTTETPTEEVSAEEIRYGNLDGLYFIAPWEYDYLKQEVEQFIDDNDITGVTTIIMPGIVEEDSLELFHFWLKLDDTDLTILKGWYYYDERRYEFEIETDPDIIEEFNGTELAPPDGIDPYAEEGEGLEE